MIRNLLVHLFGLKFLGAWLRDVANGKKGEAWRSVYLWLQGKKTWTGVILAALSAVLYARGSVEAFQAVGAVSGVLISVGLADKAWRSVPSTWASSNWWRLARTWWPDLVVLATYLTEKFTTCDGPTAELAATLHLTCAVSLAVVGAGLALGGWLFTEGKVAEPPMETIR